MLRWDSEGLPGQREIFGKPRVVPEKKIISNSIKSEALEGELTK